MMFLMKLWKVIHLYMLIIDCTIQFGIDGYKFQYFQGKMKT